MTRLPVVVAAALTLHIVLSAATGATGAAFLAPPSSTSSTTFRRSVALRETTSSTSSSSSEYPLPDYCSSSSCESEVRRTLEFKNLEPLAETEARRQRIERDLVNKAQFETFGDGLWNLRTEMEMLSSRLIDAIQKEGGKGISSSSISSIVSSHTLLEDQETKDTKYSRILRQKLRTIESRDPELAYRLAMEEQHRAEREDREADAQAHKLRAVAARSCLPQFNLDGLWVGKYGTKYELINITYVGDTLIAEKVTGTVNVPKGAISFQVDLHPLRPRRTGNKNQSPLKPILLTDKAAQKWGTRKLPRYPGLGQVAEHDFTNRQWLEGQLIIIGDAYFSFAWLPIEQQIFFGRPSPELALKMLRDGGAVDISESLASHWHHTSPLDSPPPLDADINVQKAFVARCLELSRDHEDEIGEGNNAYGGIWHCNDSDTEECYLE